MQTDEQEIRQLVSTWMAASRAGDVQKVLSLMTDDAVFLMPGQSVMRKADFAAAMEAQSQQGGPQFEGSSDIQEISIHGDWAFMWARVTVAGTSSNSSQRMVRAGHALTIFRSKMISGCWRVTRIYSCRCPDSITVIPSGRCLPLMIDAV